MFENTEEPESLPEKCKLVEVIMLDDTNKFCLLSIESII